MASANLLVWLTRPSLSLSHGSSAATMGRLLACRAAQRSSAEQPRMIEAVPYKVHTVLTDNGIQFTTPGAGGSAVPLIREAMANGELFRAHAFELACAKADMACCRFCGHAVKLIPRSARTQPG
jgi:hypothetical protein